jgi:serine phosphatase RsbU (regulator of sigma subunit)
MANENEGPRQRILIADDEFHLLNVLRLNLELENFSVLMASDGDEALQKARQEEPDVVILDVSMPKMDGYSVCKKLREEGFTFPVIMLTARTQVQDRVEGLGCGADDYVCKPFDMDELLARLAAQLRRVESVKDQIKEIIDNKWDEINEGLLLFEENQPQVSHFETPNIDVGFQFFPSGKVGGDFCQLIKKDDEKTLILLGDTVGRGIRSALLMASTFGILNGLANKMDSPRDIIAEANRIMLERLRSLQKGFVTVFVAVIDQKKGELTYCNAGSFPPILIHKKTRKHKLLETTGVFIGAYKDAQYNELGTSFEKGDRLVLYTDGLLEVKSPRGIDFGIKRFYRFLLKNMDMPVKEVSRNLMRKLEDYTGGDFIVRDDLTFLILEMS